MIAKEQIRKLFLQEVEHEIQAAEKFTEDEAFQDFWAITETHLYQVFGDKFHGISGRVCLYHTINHAITDDGDMSVVLADSFLDCEEGYTKRYLHVIPLHNWDVTKEYIQTYSFDHRKVKSFQAVNISEQALKIMRVHLAKIHEIDLIIESFSGKKCDDEWEKRQPDIDAEFDAMVAEIFNDEKRIARG